MIDTLRRQNPQQTLVVDGGDCLQGSAVAALSKGQAIVPLINTIRDDVMLPGNWEVVYGKEMLINDMGMRAVPARSRGPSPTAKDSRRRRGHWLVRRLPALVYEIRCVVAVLAVQMQAAHRALVHAKLQSERSRNEFLDHRETKHVVGQTQKHII